MYPWEWDPLFRFLNMPLVQCVYVAAAESKLSRSKSVPLSDDQIRRHREQRSHRDQWQADVAALDCIVERLRTQYAQHKGDFAIGRYEELKVRITA